MKINTTSRQPLFRYRRGGGLKPLIVSLLALVMLFALAACGGGEKPATTGNSDSGAGSETAESGVPKVVSTTTMIHDLVLAIGKDKVQAETLMNYGIDPHTYQATAGDVDRMKNADLVVYNGLHLEGKMGKIFEQLADKSVCIGDNMLNLSDELVAKYGLIKGAAFIEVEGEGTDPHTWFDVALWKRAAVTVADALMQKYPAHAADYEKNLLAHLKELDELDAYIRGRVSELEPSQRILVTAHDAFNYFSRAYSFEVKAIQGISTEAEAGTADISDLAEFIAKNDVKAVFFESAVSPKSIESLKAAVEAKGKSVEIGGELYADSLKDAETGYIATFKLNIDTIVDALKKAGK